MGGRGSSGGNNPGGSKATSNKGVISNFRTSDSGKLVFTTADGQKDSITRNISNIVQQGERVRDKAAEKAVRSKEDTKDVSYKVYNTTNVYRGTKKLGNTYEVTEQVVIRTDKSYTSPRVTSYSDVKKIRRR